MQLLRGRDQLAAWAWSCIWARMADFLKRLKSLAEGPNSSARPHTISISSRTPPSSQTTQIDEQTGTPIIAPLDTLEQVSIDIPLGIMWGKKIIGVVMGSWMRWPLCGNCSPAMPEWGVSYGRSLSPENDRLSRHDGWLCQGQVHTRSEVCVRMKTTLLIYCRWQISISSFLGIWRIIFSITGSTLELSSTSVTTSLLFLPPPGLMPPTAMGCSPWEHSLLSGRMAPKSVTGWH